MKKSLSLLTSIACMLLATSCGPDTILTQNEAGGEAVKQVIQKNFDENKQVEALWITSKQELYGELGKVTIKYWEGDKQMEQVYSSSEGFNEKLFEPEETRASKSTMDLGKPKPGKTVALKDFDVASIPAKVKEAEQFIPDEYQSADLYNYVFTADNNGKIQQRFTMNAIKKGDGKKVNGRMITQEYYQLDFQLNKSGKVVLVNN